MRKKTMKRLIATGLALSLLGSSAAMAHDYGRNSSYNHNYGHSAPYRGGYGPGYNHDYRYRDKSPITSYPILPTLGVRGTW